MQSRGDGGGASIGNERHSHVVCASGKQKCDVTPISFFLLPTSTLTCNLLHLQTCPLTLHALTLTLHPTLLTITFAVLISAQRLSSHTPPDLPKLSCCAHAPNLARAPASALLSSLSSPLESQMLVESQIPVKAERGWWRQVKPVLLIWPGRAEENVPLSHKQAACLVAERDSQVG